MDYPGPRVDFGRERRSLTARCLRRRGRPVGSLRHQVAIRGEDRCGGAADPRAGASPGLRSSPTMTRGRSALASRLGRCGTRARTRRRAAANDGSAAGCDRALRDRCLADGEPLAAAEARFRPHLADRSLPDRGRGEIGRRREFPLYRRPARRRPHRSCAGPQQWAALYALLDTLSPAELTVPARLNPLLSTGFGGNGDRQTDIEIIPTAGGPVFDPLKATEVGAVQTLDALLAAERLNRLEGQHAADASVPAPVATVRLCARRARLAKAGDEVGRRIATMSVLALARAQRDAALSPTVVDGACGPARPARRRAGAPARTGRRSRIGRTGSRRCSRTARRSTRRSPTRRGCRACRRECRSGWTRRAVGPCFPFARET